MIPLWDSYLPNAKKIIVFFIFIKIQFIVDASSKSNLPESIVLLLELINNEKYKNIPLCIVLNKIDIPGSYDTNLFTNYFPYNTVRNVFFYYKILFRI